MTKQKTWNCKECSRVNNVKFDKCYSCGKLRSEVEAFPLSKKTTVEIHLRQELANYSTIYRIDATKDEIRYINIMLSLWPKTLLEMIEDFVVSEYQIPI